MPEGIGVEFVAALVRLFNAGFVPVVPQQSSVGASGDLAPLAHMAATYMGHGEAPVVLRAKEGLALINGTEIMKAIGCVLWQRATGNTPSTRTRAVQVGPWELRSHPLANTKAGIIAKNNMCFTMNHEPCHGVLASWYSPSMK